MITLSRLRMLSLCGLFVFSICGYTSAQYGTSTGVASTDYGPLQSLSVYNGGYRTQQPQYGAYGEQPQYGAYGETPRVAYALSQGCPNCSSGACVGGQDYQPVPSHSIGGISGYSGCDYGVGPTPYYSRRPCSDWYVSAAGLYMDRSRSRRIWTTYENNNNPNQLMHTQHADTDWEAGADLRIGRYFACRRWVLELGYWSINNFEGYSSQTHANFVSSPLLFNDLEFAVGDPVADYFDSAEEHRISRTNELHNVELNIIEGRLANPGCSPWAHRMIVGVRYFKFDENLMFETLDQGGMWGGNGGLDEVALTSNVKNDMIGAQIGCMFERQVGCRTRFFLSPKFGVYGNHIEHRFDLRRGDGTAAMPSAFSGVPGSYPVQASTNVVSFLTEANIGLQHQVSCCWTLFGGYRVVVLNGIGLADNQIPQYIVDIPEIADIDTDGCLVLQGAFFGASRRF